MFMKLQEVTFAGYLRFSGNRQEVSVDIEVKNDNVLEHNETFVVTARPPAEPKRSRDAVAIITIIDDEGKLLIANFFQKNLDIYCKHGYVLNT